MSRFSNVFLTVLKEADDRDLERAAMEASLDDGTNPADFDVDLTPSGDVDEVADAMSRQNQKNLQTIQHWIQETSKFLDFLNSESPTSIQSTLANATPDTIMDRMKSAEQRKIARVASDLASFKEALKGYLAQGNSSPALRGV